MDSPEAALIREMGGKPVPAETVQDDHVIDLQSYVPSYGGGIWFVSLYTDRTRYGLHLSRVELAVFILGGQEEVS